MAGLIEQQLDLADPLKTVSGFDADLSDVNKTTDTVAGQMDTLLSKDSPYITRARTSAAQYANQRGLINSSIGAEAGESAAIGAALPIASQDANIFNTTRLTNQAAKNRSFEFNAGSQNQAKGQVFGANKALESQRLAGSQALEQIGAQGAQTRQTIGTQTGAQSQLMAQEFGQQKELTAAQFAQQKAQTILQGEIQQGLLTTEGAQRERLAQLQSQIESMLSTQAYQQTLGTAAFQEQAATRMATLQQGFSETMAKLQADLQSGVIMQADYDLKSRLMQQAQTNQLETLSRQAMLSQQMAQLQANLETGQILPAQFEQQKALLDKQFAASMTLQSSQQDFSLALQQMRGVQATALSDIEAQYKTLVQTSASAAGYFSEFTKSMTAILADPNTSQVQKDGGIAALTSLLQSTLAVIGGVSDLDLNALINFGTP